MKNFRNIALRTVIISFTFIFGIVVGTFSLDLLSGSAETRNGEKTPAVKYLTNESGLTYGSSMYATSLEEEPDLIAAYGIDGTQGYVFKKDLNGEMPQTPKEAVEITIQNNKTEARIIPLYEKDGKTIIGEFHIEPPVNVETINVKESNN